MASPSNTLTGSPDHDFDKEKYAGQADVVDVAANEQEKEPDSYYVRRLGFAGPWLQKLFSSGVEARGVERVPEDQRERKHLWNK